MRGRTIALGAMLLCLGHSVSAMAATVRAVTSANQVLVGQSAWIDVYLTPEPSEEASLFEGDFALSGVGHTASIQLDLAAIGEDWPNVSGSIGADDHARVSLTALGNRPGEQLVASIDLTTSSAGSFSVFLAAGTFAGFDIAIPPYIELLDLTTPIGSELARIEILSLPEPGTRLLMLLGVGLLGRTHRRRP
jgi:hypothetical protein